MESWMCGVDWPKAIGIFKDLVLAAAAVVTATVAVKGFSKWRSEDQGKADLDLARRALKCLFAYRLEFSRSRSPVLWVAELQNDGDEKQEIRAKALARAYGRRLEPLRAAAVSLEAVQTEVEGLWGERAGNAIHRVLRTFNTLSNSIDAVIENERGGGEDFRADQAFGKEMRMNVSSFGSSRNLRKAGDKSENPLSAEIAQAVDACATILRVKLPHPPTD